MIRRCHHRETLLPIPSWSSPFLRCSPVHWHQSLRRSFGVTTDEDSFTTVCLGATVCKHGALVDLCRSGFPGAGESIGIRASKFHSEDGHKKRGGIPIAPSGTEAVACGNNSKRHHLHPQVTTAADCCERFPIKDPGVFDLLGPSFSCDTIGLTPLWVYVLTDCRTVHELVAALCYPKARGITSAIAGNTSGSHI